MVQGVEITKIKIYRTTIPVNLRGITFGLSHWR